MLVNCFRRKKALVFVFVLNEPIAGTLRQDYKTFHAKPNIPLGRAIRMLYLPPNVEYTVQVDH